MSQLGAQESRAMIAAHLKYSNGGTMDDAVADVLAALIEWRDHVGPEPAIALGRESLRSTTALLHRLGLHPTPHGWSPFGSVCTTMFSTQPSISMTIFWLFNMRRGRCFRAWILARCVLM